MTRRTPLGEEELRALFAEIEPPSTLDKWRERVGAPTEPADVEPDAPVLLPLPERPAVPPLRPRRRAIAVAAAGIAVVVGLGAVVVANRFLTDDPPADPPSIIDDPDRGVPDRGEESVSNGPAQPTSGGRQTAPSGQSRSPGGDPGVADGQPTTGGSPKNGAPAGESPPPPMVGFPTPSNAGVPVDTTLRAHNGDLRVTTPGAVITNLRITGTVVVEAPNVTLRRVSVSGRGGLAVRQAAAASRLTIELSDLAGAVVQEAAGLTLRRCTTGRVAGRDGITVVDTYFSGPLEVSPGTTHVVARHNTVGRVVLGNGNGPVADVTVEDSDLGMVAAPTEPGSRDIRVRRNVFREDPPSTGWNSQGPGYVWTGNTSRATGRPIGP
jgi:hypothetical protein